MPICPFCGSRDARRSRRRRPLDVIQRWRGMRRYRCRECKCRYYAPLPAKEVKRARRWRARHGHPKRRLTFELLFFLVLVAVFYSLLRLFRG